MSANISFLMSNVYDKVAKNYGDGQVAADFNWSVNNQSVEFLEFDEQGNQIESYSVSIKDLGEYGVSADGQIQLATGVEEGATFDKDGNKVDGNKKPTTNNNTGNTNAADKTDKTDSNAPTGADKLLQAAAGDKSVFGTAIPEGATSADIQARIDALNAERQALLDMMAPIEKTVEELMESVSRKITEALKEQEKRVEEYEAEVQAAIQKEVEAYVQANRDGKGMTQEELQANIQGAVGVIVPGLEGSIATLFAAETEMKLIDGHIATLKTLGNQVKNIEAQISCETTKFNEVKAAEEAAKAAKSCDPIGFQVEEDGLEVQYDFFIDKDGDGQLSNITEFLGATDSEDGWNEMVGLNEDGDATITYDELSRAKVGEDGKVTFGEENVHGTSDDAEANKGQIMVMKTVKNPDGTTTQTPMTVEEAFGPDSRYGGEINIGVKKNDTLDPSKTSFNFDDPKYNNELLGNFSMTLGGNGEEITGYQTNDDVEYLKDNYTFSKGAVEVDEMQDKMNTADAKLDGEDVKVSDELATHLGTIETLEQKAADLRLALDNAWATLGFSEEYVEIIGESAGDVAEIEADKYYDEIAEAQKTKMAEEEANKSEEDDADLPEGVTKANDGKYYNADGLEVDKQGNLIEIEPEPEEPQG